MKTPDKIGNIIVPRWFLKVVENTLQIQNNINFDEKFGETCQDRNIKESLNGLRKLLKGEELTGMERLEGLQHSLPSNLDEAAKDSWTIYEYRESPKGLYSTCYVDGFKAGAEWMDGQGITFEGKATRKYERGWGGFFFVDFIRPAKSSRPTC